jgi:membrane-associated protease RseP (regulator of RpoE activity)
VHPADPGRTAKIQQIERERLGLKDSQTGRIVWVAVGELVPGFPDRRFTRAASLTGVDYRYIATLTPLDLEPRLLSIHGERATLEVDVRPSQPLVAAPQSRRGSPSGAPSTVNAVNALDRKPDVTPFDQVRVTETTPNTYDLSKAEVRDALDQGGRLLAQQWPSIQPLLSIQDGIGLQVKSPIADGVLTSPGFQVLNPNLAGRFGIKAGDVIVAINDQSVSSFRDLYNLYQQAANNPLQSEVQVKLQRQGVPVTKTYRLR